MATGRMAVSRGTHSYRLGGGQSGHGAGELGFLEAMGNTGALGAALAVGRRYPLALQGFASGYKSRP